jgi:hypothetical protein
MTISSAWDSVAVAPELWVVPLPVLLADLSKGDVESRPLTT